MEVTKGRELSNSDEVVIAELDCDKAQPPAKNHHIGSRKRDREFLRGAVYRRNLGLAGA